MLPWWLCVFGFSKLASCWRLISSRLVCCWSFDIVVWLALLASLGFFVSGSMFPFVQGSLFPFTGLYMPVHMTCWSPAMFFDLYNFLHLIKKKKEKDRAKIELLVSQERESRKRCSPPPWSGFPHVCWRLLLFEFSLAFFVFFVLLSSLSPFPPLFSLPTCSSFQMSKNKRKAASTVARRQDALHAPIVVPDDHDHDGDGSVVLALTIALGTKPNAFPCEPRTDLPPMSSSQPSDVCLSDLQPASMMVVASGSTSLDEVWVENCFVDSDEEILEEDQLDFNFSDEECDDSPKSPTLLPVENVSSPPPSGGRVPDTTTVAGNPIFFTLGSSKWRDLFFSNRSTVSYIKL